MNKGKMAATEAVVLVLLVYMGVLFMAGPKQQPLPEPDPTPAVTSELTKAATKAIKDFASATAASREDAASKLDSGELKSLDEAHAYLKKGATERLQTAFRPVGELMDGVDPKDTTASAKALREAGAGYERAAKHVK